MTRPGVLLAAAVFAACSASGSVSTPAISGLSFAGSSVPGGTEVGTFVVSNAAGTTGLSLELTLTDPTGVKSPPAVEPLVVSGAAQSEANAQVNLVVPSNGPAGMYSVTLTVSDGPDVSNPLTGTFLVN